jgi:hypothetical protein
MRGACGDRGERLPEAAEGFQVWAVMIPNSLM